MKLIIDIPDTVIQELKDGCFGVKHNVYELAGCIMNGIPLEDIKAEMQAVIDEERTGNGNINKGVVIGLQRALDTIDNYKAESEDSK